MMFFTNETSNCFNCSRAHVIAWEIQLPKFTMSDAVIKCNDPIWTNLVIPKVHYVNFLVIKFSNSSSCLGTKIIVWQT